MSYVVWSFFRTSINIRFPPRLLLWFLVVFFFKQKTAYEMRISDWSSDVCSSDLGDVVVVWKLDRLSRSLKDMLHIMERIELAGAGFRSLTEAIDTTTAAGRMMMQMVGSFAEFERAMIRERTSAGLAQARAEGRIGGRRRKLGDKQRREIAESVTSGRKSGAEMARLYGVSEPTVSRIVAAHRQQFSQQQREQA